MNKIKFCIDYDYVKIIFTPIGVFIKHLDKFITKKLPDDSEIKMFKGYAIIEIDLDIFKKKNYKHFVQSNNKC